MILREPSLCHSERVQIVPLPTSRSPELSRRKESRSIYSTQFAQRFLKLSPDFAVVTANGNPTKKKARSAHRQLVHVYRAYHRLQWGRAQSQFLFCVMISQSVANFHVESHRCARTHLSQPLRTDMVRQSPEAEHRYVNRPSFPGQRLDEITPATGTVMLAKWFVGLDLYQAGFLTRPLMAVPCLAAHRKYLLLRLLRRGSLIFVINANAISVQEE